MDATAQRHDFTVAHPVAEPRLARDEAHQHGRRPGHELTADLHPAPLLVGAASLVAVVAIFGFGFMGPMDFTIAMLVNAATLIGFLGIPIIFARVSGAFDQRGKAGLGRFLSADFDTFTGPMPASGAAILVMTVPLCLAAAAMAFTVIFHVVA